MNVILNKVSDYFFIVFLSLCFISVIFMYGTLLFINSGFSVFLLAVFSLFKIVFFFFHTKEERTYEEYKLWSKGITFIQLTCLGFIFYHLL